MTRKKSEGKGMGKAADKGFDSFGVTFVTVHLTDDDKAAIRAKILPEGVMTGHIERLADSGYKLSVSFDDYNHSWLVALTGKKGCEPKENEGYCMLSRGGSFAHAFCAMLYKLEWYCPDGCFPTIVERTFDDIG